MQNYDTKILYKICPKHKYSTNFYKVLVSYSKVMTLNKFRGYLVLDGMRHELKRTMEEAIATYFKTLPWRWLTGTQANH
jgi:hypothetical protein